MPNFFNANQNVIVTPWFSLNYWIGLILPLLLIISLFIFKKFYAKLVKKDLFRYFLGLLQLLLFIGYYVFHFLTPNFDLIQFLPFQLCSVLDLTSAFILLFPSEKLFTITLPLVGPVLLIFLVPPVSQSYYGLNNFFFYQYYLHHTIILFTYGFYYLYGKLEYNHNYLKQSVYSIAIFGIFVFLFNTFFNTDFLYIGPEGYNAKVGNIDFDTAKFAPIFRFAFMFCVALFFILSFHFLVTKFLRPYYLKNGERNIIENKHKRNKKSIIKISKTIEKEKRC